MLWEYHDLLSHLFMYYACLGGTDMTAMGFNEWHAVVTDLKLAKKHHPFCKKTNTDQLVPSVESKAPPTGPAPPLGRSQGSS